MIYSIGVLLFTMFLSNANAFADPIRVVLSGGPAFGKTSIIHELELRGKFVIRETAIDFIAYQQSRGIERPWEDEHFQTNINLIQRHREEVLHKNAEVIFQDRSLIDSFGYLAHRQQTVPKEIQHQADTMDLEQRYFPYVLFIKNIAHLTPNPFRFDIEEAQSVDDALRSAYQKFGYQIVDIQPDTVEKRVDQILEFLRSKNVPIDDSGLISLISKNQ